MFGTRFAVFVLRRAFRVHVVYRFSQ
jgi:hypothetical protein